MLLGVITGALMGPDAEMFKPIGTLFINAIKMLIVPLVFCSLVVGVTSMQDTRKMGRIGLKSVILYLATTAVAISLGLGLALLFTPGAGLNMVVTEAATAGKDAPTFVETLLSMIPENPVGALAAGNILQIIVFALGLGIALTMCGEKATPAIELFESLAEGMYKLTEIVMKLAPYGVFGLMAWVAGKYGLDILLPLIKVIAVVYLGCLIHVFVFYAGTISVLGRLNPMRYLKGIVNPAAVAFTTTSSSGSLPVSIKAAREEMGYQRAYPASYCHLVRPLIWMAPLYIRVFAPSLSLRPLVLTWFFRLRVDSDDCYLSLHRHCGCSRSGADHAFSGTDYRRSANRRLSYRCWY